MRFGGIKQNASRSKEFNSSDMHKNTQSQEDHTNSCPTRGSNPRHVASSEFGVATTHLSVEFMIQI